MRKILFRLFIGMLISAFSWNASIIPAAHAAVIETTTFIESSSQEITPDNLERMLDRQDVQEKLIALGVDPIDARDRIASLTESELRMVQEKIDDLPAGSSVLAVLGVVLVVLVVLEVLGVTNVFTKL